MAGTGKITPFAKFEDEEEPGQDGEVASRSPAGIWMSHQNLRMPGFAAEQDSAEEEPEPSPPKKRRRLRRAVEPRVRRQPLDDDYDAGDDEDQVLFDEVEDNESEAYSDQDDSEASVKRKRDPLKHKGKKTAAKTEEDPDVDDGNEKKYQARLKQWIQGRHRAREKAKGHSNEAVSVGVEWSLPHPTIPDSALSNGYRLPGDIYPSLFDYQKTCVQWLWELHQQNVGGIIGDEMGLGKTIQIISFLAGLHYSGLLERPVIIVSPATVLKQWVNECHKWWPPLRVPILHSSGSGMLNVNNEEDMEDLQEQGHEVSINNRYGAAAKRLVNRVFEKGL